MIWTIENITFIGLSVAFASCISGVFGSAGGTILLGLLLLRFNVGPAVVLFSIAQLASNLWRSGLWFRHIDWGILVRVMVGGVCMTGAMAFLAITSNKAVIYICLGASPLALRLLPRTLFPEITHKLHAVGCGALVMGLTLMAGASGGLLDVFFQRSEVPRRTVVATKGGLQIATGALRMIYFGSLGNTLGNLVSPPILLWAVFSAFCGTLISGLNLSRMTDAQFRSYSGHIISGVGISFIGRGAWLLLSAL